MKEELKLKVIPSGPCDLDFTWYFMIRDELLRRTVGQAKRVLDVGCGQGDVLLALSKQIGRGVGMDISRGEVAAAERKRKKRRIKNLAFMKANALNLPFPSNSFDVVLCLGDVLEFAVGKEGRVLSEIKRVLTKDGLAIHECGNWDWGFRLDPSWSYFIRTKDGRFYFNRGRGRPSGRQTVYRYEVLSDTPLHHWVLKQKWPFSPHDPQGFKTSLDVTEEEPIPRQWLKFLHIGRNQYQTPRSLKRKYKKAAFRDVQAFAYGQTREIACKAGLYEKVERFKTKLAKAEAELILKTRQGSGPSLFLTARK
jgi:SAM-dependent methyltransferase